MQGLLLPCELIIEWLQFRLDSLLDVVSAALTDHITVVTPQWLRHFCVRFVRWYPDVVIVARLLNDSGGGERIWIRFTPGSVSLPRTTRKASHWAETYVEQRKPAQHSAWR